MNTGTNVMPPTAPTPDDVESVAFFIQWWQQILGGTIIILTGWFLKTKGKNTERATVPVSIEEIEHRLTISEQSMLLSLNKQLSDRDKRLYEHIQKRDAELLQHIRDIIKK